MTLEASLLLASTIFILGITPGPGVLLVISRTVSGGFFAAVWTIAGIVSADLIFLVIVAYGLQVIASILDSAFIFIQTMGAVYLLWLGFTLIKNPSITLAPNNARATAQPPQPFYGLWLTGVLITLSNPKAILFYMSFLPAIIDITALTALDVVIMGVIICVTIGGIMFFYALTVLKAKNTVGASMGHKMTQRIAGSIIVATGLLLLTRAYL